MFICFQLISTALQFLATVADRNHYRYLFEDVNVLTSICEKVIIPNMTFRGKKCD
jgi:exportin-2 (importin alpha re-exporter)